MVLRRTPLSCSYGLVNYADEHSHRDHLEASVRSSQDAMNLADAQNRAGPADLLTVLDAERTLFTNHELLAQS
jgi:outer membrane protein TolC